MRWTKVRRGVRDRAEDYVGCDEASEKYHEFVEEADWNHPTLLEYLRDRFGAWRRYCPRGTGVSPVPHVVMKFPFAGTTRFEGMEELPHLLCDPCALRDGYLEALEEYLVEVRRGCTRNRERESVPSRSRGHCGYIQCTDVLFPRGLGQRLWRWEGRQVR
jgi:hypothetical protein